MVDSALRGAFVARVVPRLDSALHKGQCGRVCVVGGCAEYTGAPYFAAMAALRLGADLAHIVCDIDAATAIKAYSPDLIVHPCLRTTDSMPLRPTTPEAILSRVSAVLDRVHAVVVGPGLGRDPLILDSARAVISAARARNLPVVLDGDALFLVAQQPHLANGCVVTPNVVEYTRMAATDETPMALASRLGATVVAKAHCDAVATGSYGAVCAVLGAPRRCGGQGDVLAGALGTFLAWKRLAGAATDPLDEVRGDADASVMACAVTKLAAARAFEARGRSMLASDLLDELPAAFASLERGDVVTEPLEDAVMTDEGEPDEEDQGSLPTRASARKLS